MRINRLKITASRQRGPDRASRLCSSAAWPATRTTPSSASAATSATRTPRALMIGNDRIHATNAALLLVSQVRRDDRQRPGTRNAFHDELVRPGAAHSDRRPGCRRAQQRLRERCWPASNRPSSRTVADDGAEVMRFPPVIPRRLRAERVPGLVSTPRRGGVQLRGDDADARRAAGAGRRQVGTGARLEDDGRRADAGRLLPVYPTLSGQLPAAGRLIDMTLVLLPPRAVARPGADADVPHARARAPRHAGRRSLDWRDTLDRAGGLRCSRALGLDGRGRPRQRSVLRPRREVLAANQREQKLKFEVVVPITSPSGRPR